MKFLSELAHKYLPQQEEAKLIHAIQDAFILRYLDSPIMNNEAVCPVCGGNSGYAVLIDPSLSDKRMWFCSEANCLAVATRSRSKSTQTIPKRKRALEWALFCEINRMGDLHHDVTFEKINQGGSKIEYLLKFAKTPKGIILMEGEAGTGKTYASMGLCELFTRTSDSCLFYTSNRLAKEWVESYKSDRPSKFMDRVLEVSLLIVDDFGTGEPNEKFMEFFMEVINVRTQWSNRGTVITTNLNDKKLSKYCGEFLADRINTGQKFEFKDKSRRQQTIL